MHCSGCKTCPIYSDRCSDRSFFPVGVEGVGDIAIVGDVPSGVDAVEGRPFVGAEGEELQRALELVGWERPDLRLTNAIACTAPGIKFENYLARISKRNIARKKKKQKAWPTPMVACRERLLEELKGCTKIVVLGGMAASTLRGGKVSSSSIRGACEELMMPWGKVKVAYTLPPRFVLQSPKWRPVFQFDIERAKRYFEGNIQWAAPGINIIRNTKAAARALEKLSKAGKPIAYDVETDGINPMTAKLRCVGFANDATAMLIPLLSIDGETKFFSDKDDKKIRGMLRDFLANPPVPLLGHNAGQYDRLNIEAQLGVTPKLAADTLLLHLLADNEMPHNLGFVGSFYTDFTETWKADHTATQARSDLDLHIYCATDCCVTIRAATPLMREVKRRNQTHLIEREHLLQKAGVGMQRLGMKVDWDRVRHHEDAFEKRLVASKSKCQEIVSADFNPLSTLQLRKLLFDEWNIPPERYNEKTGSPSTDDETLRTLYTKHNLPAAQMELVHSVRMVRRYSKLLSTYIRPLATKYVQADGRVHPSYNRLPATGRYSSSAPNAQNIPAFLRDIFIPEEGHVFVGADMDQIELRLLAEESKAALLLRTISEGLDPHNENMEIVYGKSIWHLDGAPTDRKKKGKGIFKATRGVTKCVFYAWQYAASVPTIHQQVVSVEDDAGKLIYAHMGHRDIRDVVTGLGKALPEVPVWWEERRQLFRKQGYLDDPLWHRRRDFRDQEKLNELVNHPIQAAASAIVHEAMLELLWGIEGYATEGRGRGILLPFDFENRTGLVNQCHDSLCFEVPEDQAEEVASALEFAMNRKRREGALLEYTAEADIGISLLEV